jgi:hypothetical protein
MIIRTMYLDRIRPFYDVDLIKVITGVRRCGKSVLLRQIAQDLESSGVPQDNILLLSLDHYANRAYLDPDTLNNLLESFASDKSPCYILLDEVQLVPDFETVLNSLHARGLASIFITGSNSKILSGELATLLGGRTLLFHVMPFCFSEYLEFARTVPGLPESEQELLRTYLSWGGFPLVAAQAHDETRSVVLENLYSSIVLKDIVSRNNVRSVSTLENIVDYLLASSGCVVSSANIANALTDTVRKVSTPTIYDYVHSICEAYIVSIARRYDIKGKKMLRADGKAYACDPGLYRIRKSRVSDEYGHIVETVVYNELVARGYAVSVGKTRNSQIDFVVEHQGGRCYIQVAYLLANDAIVAREFGAFSAMKDAHPKYVVSMDPELPALGGIEHLNLADFLTGRKSLRFT